MNKLKTCIAILALSIVCVQPMEAGAIRFAAKGVKVTAVTVGKCTGKVAKATGKGVAKTAKVVWKVIY